MTRSTWQPLRRSWCALLAAAILLSACQPAKREIKRAAGRTEPQVRATVVTIRTTVAPANRVATHTIVIGPDFARSTGEVGSYRLFDLKQNRVLFVNDFARTFHAEPLQSLIATRTTSAARADGQPRVAVSRTGATRTIAGVPATQSILKLGAYQRELWVGSHPLIPPQLFAMWHASAPGARSEPLERDADLAIFAMRGFPMLERSELPYGSSKIVVERQVLSVEQKDVNLSLVVLPRDYEDVTPRPKAPAERRPRASSRPPGQKTPGAE